MLAVEVPRNSTDSSHNSSQLEFKAIPDVLIPQILRFLHIDEICLISHTSHRVLGARGLVLSTMKRVSLNMHHHPRRTLQLVCEECTNMRVVSLRRNMWVCEKNIRLLLSACRRLEEVGEYLTPPGTLSQLSLAPLTLVKHRQLVGQTNDLCAIADKCPDLRSALLINGKRESQALVRGDAYDHALRKVIQRCRKLEGLMLGGFGIELATMHALCGLPDLRKLGLRRGMLTDSSLAALVAGLPELRFLDITENPLVTSAVLPSLTEGLRALTHLFIARTSIDSALVEYIEDENVFEHLGIISVSLALVESIREAATRSKRLFLVTSGSLPS
eukprot:253764_1